MVKRLLSALLLAAALSALADDQPWYAFMNAEETLIGYKDAKGQVKIPPKFSTVLTSAWRFEHIIAVSEGDEKMQTYYLLKDGSKVGENSLYLFDVTPDFESENKIRFRDYKLDQVGYFDQHGKVAIPAEFSTAGPFRNGVAWALRSAKRVCAGPGNEKHCEHWSWVGGQEQLIGERGQVLVDGFEVANPDTLDWYTLQISPQPPTDPLRVSFKGVDGRYYSFIDLGKDFAAWFKND